MTNKLDEQLGITLNPFYCVTRNFTEDQIRDIHRRSVQLGAILYETVSTEGYNNYHYFGVDKDMDTYFSQNFGSYGGVEDSYLLSDIKTYLQLTEVSGRLIPNEELAYNVEAPTINSEPFITIKGVEVGSSLERALNLVVAVYNGDSVREVRDTYYGNIFSIHYCKEYIIDIVRQLDRTPNFYVLKSEDEALKAKNIKESFDKEIQELENKLQELKTKRGD